MVTIEPAPGHHVWGAAYRLPSDPTLYEKTMSELEYREKQYDLRVAVDVFTKDSPDTARVKDALCFIASDNRDTNVNYLGPAKLSEIAE